MIALARAPFSRSLSQGFHFTSVYQLYSTLRLQYPLSPAHSFRFSKDGHGVGEEGAGAEG